MIKAAFLDRDGVINVDKGYVGKIEEFEFIEGVFEACRTLNAQSYKIIIVTNQSGIGRGYFSENDFSVLNKWMLEQFTQQEVEVLDVFYCPYHPTVGLGEYKQDSEYRKPKPQMILDAGKQYDIDLKESLVVGDKPSDLQAGQAAGVGNLFYIGDNVPEIISQGVEIYTSLKAFVDTEFGKKNL